MKDADKNRDPDRARKRAVADLRCAARKLGIAEAQRILAEMDRLLIAHVPGGLEVNDLLIPRLRHTAEEALGLAVSELYAAPCQWCGAARSALPKWLSRGSWACDTICNECAVRAHTYPKGSRP